MSSFPTSATVGTAPSRSDGGGKSEGQFKHTSGVKIGKRFDADGMGAGMRKQRTRSSSKAGSNSSLTAVRAGEVCARRPRQCKMTR